MSAASMVSKSKSRFLLIFGPHMNILFLYQSDDSRARDPFLEPHQTIYHSNVGCPDKSLSTYVPQRGKVSCTRWTTQRIFICKCWIWSFNCREGQKEVHRIELMMFPSSSSTCNHPERGCTGRICCVSFPSRKFIRSHINSSSNNNKSNSNPWHGLRKKSFSLSLSPQLHWNTIDRRIISNFRSANLGTNPRRKPNTNTTSFHTTFHRQDRNGWTNYIAAYTCSLHRNAHRSDPPRDGRFSLEAKISPISHSNMLHKQSNIHNFWNCLYKECTSVDSTVCRSKVSNGSNVAAAVNPRSQNVSPPARQCGRTQVWVAKETLGVKS